MLNGVKNGKHRERVDSLKDCDPLNHVFLQGHLKLHLQHRRKIFHDALTVKVAVKLIGIVILNFEAKASRDGLTVKIVNDFFEAF